jgi:hypothetical protein
MTLGTLAGRSRRILAGVFDIEFSLVSGIDFPQTSTGAVLERFALVVADEPVNEAGRTRGSGTHELIAERRLGPGSPTGTRING